MQEAPKEQEQRGSQQTRALDHFKKEKYGVPELVAPLAPHKFTPQEGHAMIHTRGSLNSEHESRQEPKKRRHRDGAMGLCRKVTFPGLPCVHKLHCHSGSKQSTVRSAVDLVEYRVHVRPAARPVGTFCSLYRQGKPPLDNVDAGFQKKPNLIKIPNTKESSQTNRGEERSPLRSSGARLSLVDSGAKLSSDGR